MVCSSGFAGNEREEFAAQVGVFEEHAAHDRIDHLAVHVFHAAPGHAVVAGLHDDGQTVGLGLLLDQIGQLHHGLFLDLWAAHDPFGQARVFRQADHVGVFVGHDADPDLADDRAEMVAAGAAHGYGPDDHQFVEVFGVGKLRDAGPVHI